MAHRIYNTTRFRYIPIIANTNLHHTEPSYNKAIFHDLWHIFLYWNPIYFQSVLLCTFYKPNISNQFFHGSRVYRAHFSSEEKKIFFFILARKAFPIYRECVSQTMLHISQEISSITLNLSQHVNFQYFCFLCDISS